MENASKGLIMAAEVLIGVIILTYFVILYSQFADMGHETSETLIEYQLNQFNVKFTKYEGTKDCRVHDIITITNLAKQNNMTYYEEDGIIDFEKKTGLTERTRQQEISSKGLPPFYITVELKNVNAASTDTELSTEDRMEASTNFNNLKNRAGIGTIEINKYKHLELLSENELVTMMEKLSLYERKVKGSVDLMETKEANFYIKEVKLGDESKRVVKITIEFYIK